jgi:hypothetical protein
MRHRRSLQLHLRRDAWWRERRARSEDWQVLTSFQSTKALAYLHHAGSRSAQHFRAVPYDSNFGSGRLEHFPISLNRWSVMAALVAPIHVYALIIPVRWLTNRPRMQEFGEGRRWQNIFQFSNLIGASRLGRVSLSVPSENRYSSPGHRWPSERSAMVRKTKAKVSKKSTQAGKKSVRRAVGEKSRKTAKTLAAKKQRKRVTSRTGVSPHSRPQSPPSSSG